MNIIAWILFGLVAGVIAKFLLPGKDAGGVIVTILVGIVGSTLGGYLGSVIFGIQDAGTNDFNLVNMGLAVVGAVLLLLALRMFRKKS